MIICMCGYIYIWLNVHVDTYTCGHIIKCAYMHIWSYACVVICICALYYAVLTHKHILATFPAV